MVCDGTLYWITGLSGAGKTTVGTRLYYEIKKEKPNVILLDGDAVKNIVMDEVTYTLEGRRKRAMKYASLCKLLTDQGMIVICCTIAMFDEVREWNRKNNKGYVEVFLNVPLEVLKERDQKGLYSQYEKGAAQNVSGLDVSVELPKNPDIEIVNDGTISVYDAVNQVLEYQVELSSEFNRDTQYWNQYYAKNKAPKKQSLFAEWVVETFFEPQRRYRLLELGCGNGRDSAYFFRQGINVTAIDASETSVEKLRNEFKKEDITFLCDDFVCSTAIYCSQFDCVYSRFSLHAINEKQEADLINNIYGALKCGGYFFIEVRSVNDELYGKGEKVGMDEYIYEGHYRRFVHIGKLESRLKDAGFELIYSKEKRGFAPLGESDPPIIRIVARRGNV